MVPIPARQSLASCWPIFICWLVLIVHKCRRHWNKSRILLSRNGTPIGLVVRVGILGAFAILGIGLVSRCPSEFIYLLFSLDRLAIINIFRRNKTLAICISLTVASREFLVRAYFNSNNVFNYPIFYSPCGGRNNFCQPKSEYYLNRTLISTFFFPSDTHFDTHFDQDILRVLVFWRKPSAQVPPITSVTYCTSKIMTNVKEHEDLTSEW